MCVSTHTHTHRHIWGLGGGAGEQACLGGGVARETEGDRETERQTDVSPEGGHL